MNEKIVCTGNPNEPGIARHIFNLFPNSLFLSRNSGYDLLSEEGISKFKSIIKNYNIFINHSQLPPNGQEILLDIAADEWSQGHIITIGSVLEFEKWSWIDFESAESKKKLREKSLNLLSEKLKTTYIIVGGLKRNDNDHMRLDPSKVAEVIEFVINSKFNLPLIYIDDVSDELTEFWLEKKLMLI